MKRFKRLCSIALAGCLALTTLLGGVPVLAQQSPSEEIVQATLRGRGFKAPEDMGVAASQAVATSAVFGQFDGRTYAYSTANGGVFNAIDVEDNRLVFSQQLGDVTQVWTHAVAPDGTVYIAGLGKQSNGDLWMYSPAEKQARHIGVLLEGHQAWSSTTDEKGNLYVGTFQEGNAHVVKYEAATGKITDLGKIDNTDNSGYVRSMGYYNGKLYLGMGVMAKIMCMDLATGKITDLSADLPRLTGQPLRDMKFAYDMAVAGDYLLARVDADDQDILVFYDLKNEKWMDKTLRKPDGKDTKGVWGFTQLAEHNGATYVIFNRKLLRIDLSTLEETDTGIAYGAALRGASMFTAGGKDYMLTVSRYGEICWFDLTDGKLIKKDSAMMAAPLRLHNLATANNNKLYMTTYPGGPKGSEFDPVTRTFRMYNQGQAEGIVAGQGNDLYFGIYGGAVIQKMDTSTGKLTDLFRLKEHGQDRPYVMTFAEGKLLIGTIPDYQKLGGALTIYDPVTGDYEVHRNVVQDQSVVGLACKDGMVYGSTSIHGGLDIAPTAKQGRMFLWDIAAGQKVKEFYPDIPGLDTPMISGLTFDSKSNLWGAADGVLFTLDPETCTVTKYKNFYPEVTYRGKWRPVHILFGDDGLLYTDLAGKLTVVDPESENWDHVTLDPNKTGEMDFMTLAYDAEGNQNIYYLDQTVLKMIRVVDGGIVELPPKTTYVPIEQPNPSFEEYSEEIADWNKLTEEDSCAVSQEKAFDGSHSLFVQSSSEAPTGFASSAVPVAPGSVYTAQAQVYLQQGHAVLTMEYLDENGGVLAQERSILESAKEDWQPLSVECTAPEGAVHARLTASCENSGIAWFDTFSVSSAVSVPQGELLLNGDFEEQDAHWTVSNLVGPEQASWQIANEPVKNGTASMKITDTGSKASCYVVSDPIPDIVPGQTYTLRYSVFNDATGVNGSNSRCSAIVRYYGADGAQLSETPFHINDPEARGAWKDFELSSTAPAGSATAKIWLGVSMYHTSSGSYFDSLSFTANTDVQAPERVELPLSNASCEQTVSVLPGWNCFGGVPSPQAYYSISNARAQHGDVSLKFFDQSKSETIFAMSDPIPLPEGLRRCSASAQLWLEDGACSFLVRFFDADGHQVGEDKEGENVIPVGAPSPEWQTIRATVDVPEGAVTAVIGMGVSKLYTTTGAYFDNIQLAHPIDLYTLTVTDGEGSGEYEAGTAVTIRASAAPEGQAFDHWAVFGKGTVASPTSAETTFTMDAGHATVRAVFRDVSSSGSSGSSSGSSSSPDSSSSSPSIPSPDSSSSQAGSGASSGTSDASSSQPGGVVAQTGDAFLVNLLLGLVCVSLAGVGFLFLHMKRRTF